MDIAARQDMERQIVSRIVDDALTGGFSLSVDNGGDGFEITESTDRQAVIDALFQTDEERLVLLKNGKIVGSVFLVYGNDGWDVVCDYHLSIEDVMKGANQLADKFGG
jgi:hypothetical protein